MSAFYYAPPANFIPRARLSPYFERRRVSPYFDQPYDDVCERYLVEAADAQATRADYLAAAAAMREERELKRRLHTRRHGRAHEGRLVGFGEPARLARLRQELAQEEYYEDFNDQYPARTIETHPFYYARPVPEEFGGNEEPPIVDKTASPHCPMALRSDGRSDTTVPSCCKFRKPKCAGFKPSTARDKNSAPLNKPLTLEELLQRFIVHSPATSVNEDSKTLFEAKCAPAHGVNAVNVPDLLSALAGEKSKKNKATSTSEVPKETFGKPAATSPTGSSTFKDTAKSSSSSQSTNFFEEMKKPESVAGLAHMASMFTGQQVSPEAIQGLMNAFLGPPPAAPSASSSSSASSAPTLAFTSDPMSTTTPSASSSTPSKKTVHFDTPAPASEASMLFFIVVHQYADDQSQAPRKSDEPLSTLRQELEARLKNDKQVEIRDTIHAIMASLADQNAPSTSPLQSSLVSPTTDNGKGKGREELSPVENANGATTTNVTKAMHTIDSITAAFHSLIIDFDFPPHLDFTPAPSPASSRDSSPLRDCTAFAPDSESISDFPASFSGNATERLAYTVRNHPVRFYEQSLNGLLAQLDEVESFGNEGVRAARREIVSHIERALEDVETEVEGRYVLWAARNREKAARVEKELEKRKAVKVDDSARTVSPVGKPATPAASTNDLSAATTYNPVSPAAKPAVADDVPTAGTPIPRVPESTSELPVLSKASSTTPTVARADSEPAPADSVNEVSKDSSAIAPSVSSASADTFIEDSISPAADTGSPISASFSTSEEAVSELKASDGERIADDAYDLVSLVKSEVEESDRNDAAFSLESSVASTVTPSSVSSAAEGSAETTDPAKDSTEATGDTIGASKGLTDVAPAEPRLDPNSPIIGSPPIDAESPAFGDDTPTESFTLPEAATTSKRRGSVAARSDTASEWSEIEA
ncbi:hypothetical protein FISHEDRAFT_75721 [Fistulina hepatica ATCC 64428]|uniref:BAG domain-containing protein n=1 Tax=Fistulina hepatica ATCC 64428 TaxID=1128425 RepID=A0A0D7A6F1_9AGAR|nr:hypothetical protein FISHEDRAFT_75721 [Fistulina hepatica ATCC 64428]